MEPNPVQETPASRISKAEFQVVCDEAEALMRENSKLKKRIAYLELQIATHAFGGWQLH